MEILDFADRDEWAGNAWPRDRVAYPDGAVTAEA
jgi:hypothetical protein